jgi:hypothetical protein
LINDTLGPTNNQNDRNLKITLFTIALTRPLNQSESSGTIEPLNNNYFEINAVNKNNGNRPEFSELICVNNSDVPTPLFSFSAETDSIKIASSYLTQPILVLPRLIELNGNDQNAFYSGISEFVITIWEAGILIADDPATPNVIEQLNAEYIKNYIDLNLSKGTITQDSFDSYINVVKIAENYF